MASSNGDPDEVIEDQLELFHWESPGVVFRATPIFSESLQLIGTELHSEYLLRKGIEKTIQQTIWSFPKIGIPQIIQVMDDHDFVVKPMVTWGSIRA